MEDHPQVRCADQRFIDLQVRIPPRLRQQITGNMFAYKLIVADVIIEGAN